MTNTSLKKCKNNFLKVNNKQTLCHTKVLFLLNIFSLVLAYVNFFDGTVYVCLNYTLLVVILKLE